MKQIIILGLASMLVLSSFKEKSEAILTLDIQNFDPELLVVWDDFGKINWQDHLKNEGGKYVITLPIDKPTMRYFACGSVYKRIFLYPGQSLEISFDSKNVKSTFKYGGSLAKENVMFDSLSILIENVDRKYLYSQPLDIALNYLDSVTLANSQYFEKLFRSNPTTNIFIDFTNASILYQSARLKLDIIENYKGVIDSKHYSFLNQITIENDKFIGNSYYQWFLSAYISIEARKRYDRLDSIEKLSTDAVFYEELKVIDKLENQNVREFSLTYSINSRLRGYGTKDFDKYYDYFKKNNSNPNYSEVISKHYEKKLLLAKGQPAPTFTLEDVDGNQVSLGDFKGQYVLIDFWQTLCPNSARELPHYLKLYDDYKDKNIAFVSISVNVDENVWRQYVKEKKNVGFSLRAGKLSGSEVYKAYQVPYLPSFIIIDRAGNIVDAQAAKPSSVELREALDELLKNP